MGTPILGEEMGAWRDQSLVQGHTTISAQIWGCGMLVLLSQGHVCPACIEMNNSITSKCRRHVPLSVLPNDTQYVTYSLG